jgi:hypothetical protein
LQRRRNLPEKRVELEAAARLGDEAHSGQPEAEAEEETRKASEPEERREGGFARGTGGKPRNKF